MARLFYHKPQLPQLSSLPRHLVHTAALRGQHRTAKTKTNQKRKKNENKIDRPGLASAFRIPAVSSASSRLVRLSVFSALAPTFVFGLHSIRCVHVPPGVEYLNRIEIPEQTILDVDVQRQSTLHHRILLLDPLYCTWRLFCFIQIVFFSMKMSLHLQRLKLVHVELRAVIDC